MLEEIMLFYDFNLLMTNMNVLILFSINVRKLVLIFMFTYSESIWMASQHNQKWIRVESIIFLQSVETTIFPQ